MVRNHVETNKNDLKESLSEDEIISLVLELGSETYRRYKNNLIFQTLCHQGTSYKLYYYTNTCLFKCYSECSTTFDIFELIQKVRGYSFKNAIDYVARKVGREYKRNVINADEELDWKWINRIKKYKNVKEKRIELLDVDKSDMYYDKSILDVYRCCYSQKDFINDGIDTETQKLFDIGFAHDYKRITIPVYDIDDNLLGVKGRIIKDLEEYNRDKKYIAIHPYKKSEVLYGLNMAKDEIKNTGKLIVVEAEKSVMKLHQAGYKNAVAISGSDISDWQRSKIISVANEVIIAMDKGYTGEQYKKIINGLNNYVNLSIILDHDDLTDDKDSPIDQGIEIFNELYSNRVTNLKIK